jgi:hypothetical protein
MCRWKVNEENNSRYLPLACVSDLVSVQCPAKDLLLCYIVGARLSMGIEKGLVSL